MMRLGETPLSLIGKPTLCHRESKVKRVSVSAEVSKDAESGWSVVRSRRVEQKGGELRAETKGES